jgi:hypothetical protein
MLSDRWLHHEMPEYLKMDGTGGWRDGPDRRPHFEKEWTHGRRRVRMTIVARGQTPVCGLPCDDGNYFYSVCGLPPGHDGWHVIVCQDDRAIEACGEPVRVMLSVRTKVAV